MVAGVALFALTFSTSRGWPQTLFKIKWDQPPEVAQRTNVFNGWNQVSMRGQRYAADDWVCTTTNPVTGIRWWGSFLGWVSNTPPALPDAFFITIWTDVPQGPGNPWSHPGEAIQQVICTNYTWKCAGLDYDPRDDGTLAQQVETCFVFAQHFTEREWFRQYPLDKTNVFWVSIEAFYAAGTPNFPWGWKTRTWSPKAPDAAVEVFAPLAPVPGSIFGAGAPIYWPTTQAWDLAFELFTGAPGSDSKWEQLPDISLLGMDVNATGKAQTPPPPYLLADDFLCTTSGFITNITIWGSWLRDLLPLTTAGLPDPNNVVFTLSIHADIPTNQSPTGYSMPGNVLKVWTFGPGQFAWREYATNIEEGWMDPPAGYLPPPADKVCHEYSFYLTNTVDLFFQDGTPTAPKVFWLDMQARPLGPNQNETTFGWKTSRTHWNDAAVWVNAFEPYAGLWQKLVYPLPHPLAETNIDLAFRINTEPTATEELKWSQPPLRAHATNLFNGWDEVSRFDGQQIVADDWVCTNAEPVSDIHWWGSFLGWTHPDIPPQLPSAFHIAIWTDVPPSAGTNFSHPGKVIHQIICTNVVPRFVGWDIDPRTGDCPEVEATFKWDCFLDRSEWFTQPTGSNIFWVSISALYTTTPQYPWGWKTRPRSPSSPAPDAAVRIFNPTAPFPGAEFINGAPIEYPAGKSWDMAFTLTSPGQVEELDFGDAPDTAAALLYPTLLINNGARHTITGLRMGLLVDAEADGQPNVTATGDDLAISDDEDGVIFLTTPFLTGQPGSVVVVASGAGRLNLWIDWGADSSWAQPGDHVLVDVPLVAGPNVLNFPVPAAAVTGNTFARFRFSTAAGLSYTGAAPDGEVEDYLVQVSKEPTGNEQLDFGDAPDSSIAAGFNYPTVLAANGARHVILANFMLGTNIDAEPDGQPNPSAIGDDIAALDDEDGVVFTTPVRRGTNACVDVVLTSLFGAGLLDAWVDFNRNGVWDHPAEQIFSSQPLVSGLNAGLCFPVPASAKVGRSYARFRLTSYGGQTPPGFAQNGEVEDYVLTICQKKPTVIVITNVYVTNVVVGLVTNQAVTIQWAPEPDTDYQLEEAQIMTNTPAWSDVGPQVTAPAHSITVTNPLVPHRFYRIKAPVVCP